MTASPDKPRSLDALAAMVMTGEPLSSSERLRVAGAVTRTARAVESAPSHERQSERCGACEKFILDGKGCSRPDCGYVPSTTPQKTLATHITDESLERINDLHKIVRDNARSDYHDAMEKFQNLVGVMWENIYSRCAGTTASATERNAVIEECAAIADYLYENGADTDGSVLLVDCSNKIRDLKNRADGGKQT